MIDDDKKRIRDLTQTVRELSQQIDWLLPFLDKKAKESGDVAGMQLNARQASDAAKRKLNFYDVIDASAAKDIARD